jgi:hypothetical protein
MEAEGLVPCSQEPATEPYPKPDGSVPYLGPRSDTFYLQTFLIWVILSE